VGHILAVGSAPARAPRKRRAVGTASPRSRRVALEQRPRRLHSEDAVPFGRENRPEHHAREDRCEEKRIAIVVAHAFDEEDVAAAAREQPEAGRADARIGRFGIREIARFTRTSRDVSDRPDGVFAREDDPPLLVDRRRGAVGPRRGEAELRVEEGTCALIPFRHLEAGVGPLREDRVGRTLHAARIARGSHSSASVISAMLVDTHCHLDSAYFPDGADAAIERAVGAGVDGFVVVGVGRDLAPARHAVALATRLPERVSAAVGIHPHDAATWSPAAHEELAALARDSGVVAVGEIGLDYHYDHSPRDTQRKVFARLVALAREVKKPIVIHTRDAAADTLAVLEAEGARDVGGVIHCFSEDRPFAERALDLGFDLSFSGIVTFKGAKAIHEVAAWAPLDRILVETDSPYLAPVPMRGKPCEPAYIVHTAKRVAELRGITVDAVAQATTDNAERRFRRAFRAGSTSN
jgi:TatD DNase family protein